MLVKLSDEQLKKLISVYKDVDPMEQESDFMILLALKELEEYRAKHKDGRLVELPCKLGDTVFHISKGVNSGEWMPVTSHTVTNIYLNIGKEAKLKLSNTYGTFLLSDFGVTVFLTEEAAQQAMENNKKEKQL